MAGIYLHIPFCKQACHYCDFHFSTNRSRQAEMVEALSKELALRSRELNGEVVETIYFGGGTPSLLTKQEIEQLLHQVQEKFTLHPEPEITLEANPDDLDPIKLEEIKASHINRLSIGIQTFDDDRLKFINRAHSREEALACLTNARRVGFDNISADLIYALPPDDLAYWERDLDQLIEFDLEHLSLYGLTIEEKTVFGKWRQKEKLKEVPENTAATQYELAIERMKAAGFQHYEVSNFCKPGFHSRHNTGYWEDKKYLGIGPGAHSYDGTNRGANISNNSKYIQAIEKEELPITIEQLSKTDQLNDFIFTHLRTRKGLNCQTVLLKFGVNVIDDYQYLIDTWLNDKLIELNENTLALTSKGFMIADEITWRLFYDS